MTNKREEYIAWDSYFLGLAAIASFRSKDPSTQNGACIVDPVSRSPLAMGYNGFPRGCEDDEFPWGRDAEDKADTKYPYVEHAERNAIYNAARKGISLDGSILYLYSEKGYYPCDECARAIIQSGIKRVVMGWAIDSETDRYSWDATLRMFEAADIKIDVLCKRVPYEIGDEEISDETIADFDLISRKMDEIAHQLDKTKYEEDE